MKYWQGIILSVRRGEIYLVDWDPARGSEQKGKRPALVIQNNIGNDYGSTTIVASISTKFKKVYPFQVLLRARETGLDYDSIVDLQQIMTVDKTRLISKIGQIEGKTIPLINTALVNSLNLI
jgi:mRNA interferase MazF